VRLRPSAITLATSSGAVAATGRLVTAGGLADTAGFQAIHSQRFAVVKAPDKMLWMFRIVLAVIGLHTCGWQPARLQSWSRPRAVRGDRRSGTVSPATTAVRPWRTTIRPSSARTHPRADRIPDRICHLLPGPSAASGIDSQDRYVPVLDEPLTGAPGIATAPQLRIQQVEQRPVYLADLHVPESGLDHPPDVDLVRLPGRQIPVGDLDIPVHELSDGGVGLRLAPRRGLLEQFAEFDLRRPFGLAGLPQPDLAACQRIGPGVDLHPPGSAGELLYVSGRLLTHDITVTRITDIRSTSTMINMVFCLVGRQGVEP
jgi:hypothetical protein